jgi:hypothetical protein
MAETHDELGQEIRRLLEGVQEWARRFPAAEPRRSPGECLPWCPICQFAHVLRGEHPEVTERLTEAATAIATAMKALADTALNAGGAAQRRPIPAPRVEHITLDDTGP